MTAPAADGPQSLLARLMAVVRAEFRSQTLIFEPDDPVFGGGALPSERLRAPCPRARLVSEPSSAMGQAGSPGSGGVHHAGRSAVAAATTEPAVRGRWLRIRIRAQRLVPAARSALGTGRAARPRDLDGRSAGDQAATGRGELPHPALRALAGGVGAVLPFPQRDLAGQRPTRDRHLRREVRPRPGRARRSVDPARPTAAAAETGDAIHAAAAPRPARRQARPEPSSPAWFGCWQPRR